jgi:hypothetical protein
MKHYTIPSLILVIFLFAGCQSTAPTSVAATVPPTIPATQTPIPPTETIAPTDTPTPTATPEPPTETPTPTMEPPEILSKYLAGIKFIRVTTFDSEPRTIEYNSNLVKIVNGEMQMKGVGYQGGMNFRSKFWEGEGIVFDMKILSETPSTPFEFETYVDHGTWWTDTYRRFGMYLTSSPASDLWMGKVGTGNYLSGNLIIKPDVQYRVAIAIGEDADFLGLIWNPEKPDVNRYFHQPMGKKWIDNDWLFVINGAKGNMTVDNIMTFTFDGFQK